MSQYDDEASGKEVFSFKKWLGYTLALVLTAGAFASGLYIGQTGTVFGQHVSVLKIWQPATVTEGGETVNLDEFWRVWNLLEEKFVTASTTQQISAEERLQGAINGLVDAYSDPYTVYLPPADAERFEEDISGNFSGVGMEVGMRDGLITIISPLPGTPAERSGLLSGDVIVKIDDVSTENMRIDEAVRLIRGEKGSIVTFSIFREGDTEFRTIDVTRDNIDIPTVKTERNGDTFIIALYSFNAVSESKMQEAINEFVASKATTLVIDLRGNPGGFMQSAVDIGSFFLPAGKVVVREQTGEGGEDKVFRSRNRQVREFTPQNLIVLVDNGSASASEILAGALKDHGVATVIGTPTFGKGSVQELVELGDGSSLKVTIARWFTPNGVSISDGGLQPDILISRTPAHREAGVDPQKEAALKFLKGEEVTSESFTDDLKAETGDQ
jgi:carboxyl-terminal processing protease